MLVMLTSIVNFVSPPARRTLESVKLEGQKKTAATLNVRMTRTVISSASLERLNQRATQGIVKKSSTLAAAMPA